MYRRPCLRKEKRKGETKVSECSDVTDSLVGHHRGEPRKSPSKWTVSSVTWDRASGMPLRNSQRELEGRRGSWQVGRP